MNRATEDVKEFLNFPDLDLGTPLDPDMLGEPGPLRDLVSRLLDGPLPSRESRALAETLRGRLDEADWAEVAREMRGRLGVTARFFDPVEENIRRATE
jgi:hypothetical protein